jgi:cell shape-determining protein MreC
MTDIVERVRAHDWDGSGFGESLAEEAADEIERLRAIAQAHNDSLVERIEENEALRDENEQHKRQREYDNEQMDRYEEQITALRAENERLREALRQIADSEEYLRLGDKARAALKGTIDYNERWKSKP